MTEFITKWSISNIFGETRELTLELPLIESGTYDFVVDWGDGSNLEHISAYYEGTHCYETPGIYIVRIKGIIKGWKIKGGDDFRDYELLDVCQWGCLKLGNEGNYFLRCEKLQITAKDAPDLSETTNLENMFYDCTEFNSPIGHWDVSNVTNMDSMFCGASSFNQPLESWNVSHVTNMYAMFLGASSFNQPIDEWNVSRVTNMREIFSCTSFNQPLNSWNVSHVTDMREMFSFSSFNQPLESWDVSNVIDMEEMFNETSAFNQDISIWKVSNVISMYYMFNNAISFDNTNRSKLQNWIINSPQVVEQIFGLDKGLFSKTP
jgi:surface protein